MAVHTSGRIAEGVPAMTASIPTASVPTAVIPSPRPASEPVRRPRREHPRSEYWDVRDARWVSTLR